MTLVETKFSDGKFYVPVEATIRQGWIDLSFGYNADLLTEVKTRFEGRKWNGESKQWSFPTTQRNLFQYEALKGKYGMKPYTKWDKKKDWTEEIRDYCARRAAKVLTPYNHQVSMVNQAHNVGWFIWAAEMGTGKTLAAIILMEMSGINDWVWAGPKAPLVAVQLEFMKWRSNINPLFITYDGLKELVKNWPVGTPAPKGLILDEISRCKTPAAQRTIAAKHLADSMRNDHGENCIIGGLSGTPSPKNPSDWWSLCEIVAPGFIRESNIHLFKSRLGILQERDNGTGKYNHLVGWKDDDKKCGVCGQYIDHINHRAMTVAERMTVSGTQTFERHNFKPSANEVATLAKRLNGLVAVWLKKDCLDLPLKRYEVRRIKPSRSLINAAKLITDTSTRAVETLTRLRTLSDGFQYKDTKVGEEQCNVCVGNQTILDWQTADGVSLSLNEAQEKHFYIWTEDENGVKVIKDKVSCDPTQVSIECPRCKGTGTIDILERTTAQVECGKDDVLRADLESHEEGGRLIVFAGFTGSVERVERICHQEGWCVLRVDGRGWNLTNEKGVSVDCDNTRKLQLFQEGQEEYPRMVFVGQPGAGGMGITLTASPTTIFFSNDFNAESRIQAEDRNHRPGMDLVKGGLIVDYIHLPSDEYVLENLKKKKDLQMLSMIGLKESMEVADESSM